MPMSDLTDQGSDESQVDEENESQEDSEELPDDPEKLKELLKKERAKKERVVKDNQNLRQRINGNKKEDTSKKNEPNIPPALVARAQKAAFFEEIGSENVLDRDLLWLAAKELLEFNSNFEPTNVADVMEILKKKHKNLFRTNGRIDGNSNGRRVNGSPSDDSFRQLINAARGHRTIGGLGED